MKHPTARPHVHGSDDPDLIPKPRRHGSRPDTIMPRPRPSWRQRGWIAGWRTWALGLAVGANLVVALALFAAPNDSPLHRALDGIAPAEWLGLPRDKWLHAWAFASTTGGLLGLGGRLLRRRSMQGQGCGRRAYARTTYVVVGVLMVAAVGSEAIQGALFPDKSVDVYDAMVVACVPHMTHVLGLIRCWLCHLIDDIGELCGRRRGCWPVWVCESMPRKDSMPKATSWENWLPCLYQCSSFRNRVRAT